MNWRIGWVPFSALLVAQAAQAQSVGYEETLAAARAEQPMLEAGALRVQARRDAADAADELPDPRVRAGVMNLPVTGPAAFNPYAQLPTQLAVGIESERELLAGVAAQADRLIDTSGLNVHELRTLIFDHVSGTLRRLGVRLISFGFRYGTPGEAELLFDARFLANPYFEETLRECTGRDPEVARFVLEGDTGREFLNRLREWLAFLLPQYDAEGKPFLTLAVGCTGGHHRSVAVVEALASTLREEGRSVSVEHRDLEKRH